MTPYQLRRFSVFLRTGGVCRRGTGRGRRNVADAEIDAYCRSLKGQSVTRVGVCHGQRSLFDGVRGHSAENVSRGDAPGLSECDESRDSLVCPANSVGGTSRPGDRCC